MPWIKAALICQPWEVSTCLTAVSVPNTRRLSFRLGCSPPSGDQAACKALYTPLLNCRYSFTALSSAKGRSCIMITPATRFAGSIQKYVLAAPAQARLPALRPAGPCCVLMRKLSPYFWSIPGKKLTSFDAVGMAAFRMPAFRLPI